VFWWVEAQSVLRLAADPAKVVVSGVGKKPKLN